MSSRGPITAATQALDRLGIDYRPLSYRHDPRAEGYGLEAAAALGVPPQRVFKTLVVDVDGRLVVAVVPVSSALDLKRLATLLQGRRAVMADPALAERRTGYVVGGISPLGQRTPLPLVLDGSASDHSAILVSGGRRGLDLELAPQDLLRATDGRLAAIAVQR